MAGKSAKKQNIAVSPRNGQPVPEGIKFTSATAREAARKKHDKIAAQKSITAAFLHYMREVVATDKKDGTPLTGAQAIAKSIIHGAMKGNAEMVKIALALTGETPDANKALDEIVKVIIDV